MTKTEQSNGNKLKRNMEKKTTESNVYSPLCFRPFHLIVLCVKTFPVILLFQTTALFTQKNELCRKYYHTLSFISIMPAVISV